MNRRFLLRTMLAIGAVMALPRILFAARPDNAFAAASRDQAIADLFDGTPVASDRVVIKIPEIAENGAVVPVTISTDLEKVESISIIVDKNPTPLAAFFELSPRSVSNVSLRIKMQESSAVRAVVKADGKLFMNSKDVKVTIGGCGG